MKYKLSKYNFYIENEANELLMYNSLAGAKSMIKLTKNNKKYIYSIKNKPYVIIDDPNDMQRELINLGYLKYYEENEDEKIHDIFNNTINSKVLSLIIVPTENCNLRCVYCCEEFENHKMSMQMQESIIEYIEKNIDKYSGLNVNWFGGEPLLAMDVIRNLSTNFIRICKEHKKLYSSFMVTNGTLLDIDTFKELYKLKILMYQITLDGVANIHDNQRVDLNKKGTFNKIFNNLLCIKNSNAGKYATILVLTNCSENIRGYLDEYKKIFYENFGNDRRFGFCLQYIMDLGGNRINDYRYNILGNYGMNEIYRYLGQNSKYRLNYYYKDFLNPGGQVCYAAKKSSYLISSYGKVYKCEHIYQTDKNNFIGEFDLKGNMNLDNTIENLWNGKFNYCNSHDCKLKPLCGGEDCIKHRVLNNDINFKNKCDFKLCHFKKESFESVLIFLDVECNMFKAI